MEDARGMERRADDPTTQLLLSFEMSGPALTDELTAASSPVLGLLADADLVGGIYTMGYEDCLVLTNDLWKARAGGVPLHCFLLATTCRPGQPPADDADEEAILLRVTGPATLPDENHLVQVRAEAMEQMVTDPDRDPSRPENALDILTRNRIQFSAVRAKVVGTFYERDGDLPGLGEEAAVTDRLEFGSDLAGYYSASRYYVYKPYGRSLEAIAGYFDRSRSEGFDAAVRLGVVRYTSTRRRRGEVQRDPVPVRVNVEDFVSMKTAVFGMTRLGKSNTMKTLATAVFKHARDTDRPIGQLLFDPAGEYANTNVQDQTALSELGEGHVTIFRYGVGAGGGAVRPLGTNFFRPADVAVTWSIIDSYLSRRNDAAYVRDFLAADVVGPTSQQEFPGTTGEYHSERTRATRRRSVLYATLLKADFRPARGYQCRFAVAQRVREIVAARDNDLTLDADGRGIVALSGVGLVKFWAAFWEVWKGRGELPEADRTAVQHWGEDTGLQAILTIFSGEKGAGFRLLTPAKVFHATGQQEDYAEAILAELTAGRIVIVDLSLGNETVLKFCSERIVLHLLNDAQVRFREGEDPRRIQIYLEEAHRLFTRDKMNAPEERDPYVRLAKEAAKFKIGLVYATQEVTSVDPIILSNTSNWVVTHLNNRVEVKELSKYYDFADFADLTLRSEDVGFARVKTRSGRYIIPTHIDLFDGDRVRWALGEEAGEEAE